jgi:hypothetical protein
MQRLSKRAIASRANGAKSRGPKSIDGKRRSSANSIRHGLLAKCVVLQNESENVFGQFFDEHLQKLNPADGIEYAMVEEMAAAAWRLRRIWKIESTLFNKAIDRSTADTEAGRTADAFSALASGNQLQLLDRYESRLHRMYQRSLKTLLDLRKVPEVQPHPEPNEPKLIPTDNYRPESEAETAAQDPAGETPAQKPSSAVWEQAVSPAPNQLPNEPNPDATAIPINNLPPQPNEPNFHQSTDDEDDPYANYPRFEIPRLRR